MILITILILINVITIVWFRTQYFKLIVKQPALMAISKDGMSFILLFFGFVTFFLFILYKVLNILGINVYNSESDLIGDAAKVSIEEIVSMTIEQQSEYADFIVQNNVNEKWLIEQILEDNKELEVKFDQINTTSIGNLAYISLFCNNENVSKITKEALEKITEYFTSQKK